MNSAKLPIVAIVGRANVGKSSLFNAFLERREAIVTREAGTTRDRVTAIADFRGKNFWIVDTAGYKDPNDDFEATIQEQIIQASQDADLVLVVVEAGVLCDDDHKVATLALKTKKPVLLAVNKVDQLSHDTSYEYAKLGITNITSTSVTQSRGINQLLEEIVSNITHVSKKEKSEKIRVALLGRPNVGKSSLFNSLLSKQQAIVTERAGTTRDVNRASVRYKNKQIEFMDTAGIRRPGRIERGVEHFSVLRSLAAIEEADICFVLIDSNEPDVSQDQKIAGMVKDAGRGLALLISKWDSLSEKEDFDYDKLIRQISSNYEFVAWAPMVVTSSITGQNITKLFDLILSIDDGRKVKVSTSELNNWLVRTVREHPPAGLKNRLPKLNYIVQETDNPIPAFKIFGSQTKFIHWSYRRYLETRLREQFGFFGNPIQIWFIEKHEAHRHGERPKEKAD